MSRLIKGQKMPDFVYSTPFSTDCRLSETVKQAQGKTALIFLRYYGCTLCQYDIHRYAQIYDRILALKGQLLVVFQSEPKKLAAQLKEDDLPFSIICDPEQKLYKDFDIKPAESKEAMTDEHTMDKIMKAREHFSHGDYEGNELQLPALFVLDRELNITHVHYGLSVNDSPEPGELIELLG